MMRSSPTVRLAKAMMGNSLSRSMLSSMCNYCEVDGDIRLEVAADLLTGKRSTACTTCWLAGKGLHGLISVGALGFGVHRQDVVQALQDKYWRKGLVNVVRGIATFGVRQPFVPGAPFQVVWDVTYACNLRCKHCYASAGTAHPDELTTAQAHQLIDRLSEWGVSIIAFSGGEPLVRPDLLELAKHAGDEGIYVAIATNGTLITRKKAAELKEAGVGYLQISLDGANPSTHDTFRGIQGAFARTMTGLENAVEQGFFTTISTTATRSNLNEIPQIIELAEKLGINWVMVYNFIPSGRGQGIRDVDLDPQEREALLHQLYEYNQRTKCQVLTTAPQFARVAMQSCRSESFIAPTHFYNLDVDRKLAGLTGFIGGCGAGRFYVAVRSNGDMDPCVFFPQTVGNALKDDLTTLWRNDPLLNDLRDKDRLKGHCGVCEYRRHCGGCRARAFGYTGDHLAPDPGCINNATVHCALTAGRSI